MTTRGVHHSPRYEMENGSGGGEFGIAYHLEMLSDCERVARCKEAICAVANPDLTFCELGAGSGIFSILAARKFAQVIAVERDEKMVALIKDAAQRLGLTNLHIYHGDALEVVTRSFLSSIDVLFCEMMSTWLVVEPQVTVMNKVAREAGQRVITRIPSKVHNLIEAGNYSYDVMGVTLRAPIPQFSGIRSPRILSPSVLAHVHDLTVVNEESVTSSVQIRALASGVINCVRLSSIVQLAPLISFYSTDTLMPPLIVPVYEPVQVLEGDLVEIAFRYRCRSTIEEAEFRARVITN